MPTHKFAVGDIVKRRPGHKGEFWSARSGGNPDDDFLVIGVGFDSLQIMHAKELLPFDVDSDRMCFVRGSKKIEHIKRIKACV